MEKTYVGGIQAFAIRNERIMFESEAGIGGLERTTCAIFMIAIHKCY